MAVNDGQRGSSGAPGPVLKVGMMAGRTLRFPSAFGWPIIWGVVLAAPDPRQIALWSRIGAACVVVWLLAWAAAAAEARSTGAGPAVPGGPIALVGAGLTVAALLGPWPFALAAITVATTVITTVIAPLGLVAAAPRSRLAGPAGRAFAAALLAWFAVGGANATRIGAGFQSGWFSAPAEWAAKGADVVTLAGCSMALAMLITPAGPRARMGAVLTVGLILGGLALADRPAGLWLAALAGAALWPSIGPSIGPSVEAENAPVRGRFGWLPLAMAGVCAIDALLS